MEVGSNGSDVEIDTLLLQQFSCMATQDREALIAQFENLFGSCKPSRDVCAFYLEMNNWNLPAAVGSYFELQQDTSTSSSTSTPSTTTTTVSTITDPSSSSSSPSLFPTPTYFSQTTSTAMPSACLENAYTFFDDQKVLVRPPNYKFHHSWKVKNNGLSNWPAGCTLRFISGTQMSITDRVSVDRLAPFAVGEVGVDMTTPSDVGSYESTWQLSTMTGTLFGDEMRVYIQVTNDINLLMNLGYNITSMSNNNEMMSSDDCDNNVMLSCNNNVVNDCCQDIDADVAVAAGRDYNSMATQSVTSSSTQTTQTPNADFIDSDSMEMS